MRGPSALLDKNILESLSYIGQDERDAVFSALFTKYQVMLPFVLIEEIWTNYINPRNSDAKIAALMREMALDLRNYWLEEELELMFEELVKCKKTPPRVVLVPAAKVDSMATLHPNTPSVQQWLAEREAISKQMLEERLKRQKQIVPPGQFMFVKSEREFLLQSIKPWFDFVRNDKKKGEDYLNRFVGERLTKRYRGHGKRIRRAVRAYAENPFRFMITTNCVLSDLFYDYAPVYRVINGERHGRAIIQRGKSDQRNNYDDQRYVASALLCDRIITRDFGMASMMECFNQCGLWSGKVIYTPQPEPITDLASKLV